MGTEHLLLGLIGEGTSTASIVLQEFGLNRFIGEVFKHDLTRSLARYISSYNHTLTCFKGDRSEESRNLAQFKFVLTLISGILKGADQ